MTLSCVFVCVRVVFLISFKILIIDTYTYFFSDFNDDSRILSSKSDATIKENIMKNEEETDIDDNSSDGLVVLFRIYALMIDFNHFVCLFVCSHYYFA